MFGSEDVRFRSQPESGRTDNSRSYGSTVVKRIKALRFISTFLSAGVLAANSSRYLLYRTVTNNGLELERLGAI